jgi:hypothetical protein
MRASGSTWLANSSISRDLPTPAWATIVARRHEDSRPRFPAPEDLELACAADERPAMVALDDVRLLDRNQPVRRNAFCLPLQLEGLDRLDGNGVPNQAVGRFPDEYLVCRRRLLEPCRRIDRVPCDEPLPGSRVADLACADVC